MHWEMISRIEVCFQASATADGCCTRAAHAQRSAAFELQQITVMKGSPSLQSLWFSHDLT